MPRLNSDAIQACLYITANKKRVRQEMIDVGQTRTQLQDADFPRAVEALALLITVKGVSRRRYVHASTDSVFHIEHRGVSIISDGEQ